jgi:hypothetical protein
MSQVKTILDAQHAGMRARSRSERASGTTPSLEQMRSVREPMRTRTVQQLAPVLSAAQLKKFEVLMEEHRGEGRGPHDPPPPGRYSCDDPN